MSRFTSHLGLCTLEFSTGLPASRDGLALWYFAEPLPYEVGEKGSGKFLIVPALERAALTDADIRAIIRRQLRVRGVTDLGSIPRLGRWVVAPSDPVVKAFGLHDDGYVTQGASWVPVLGRSATRKEVDAELRVSMAALGAPKWKQAVVHASVSLGGGRGWGT